MANSTARIEDGPVRIDAPVTQEFEQILQPEALQFLVELHTRFDARRRELLERRAQRQKEIDGGVRLDFLPETERIRKGDWSAAPIPQDLLDRRIEITGPVDRKMIINALNSGASCFMADLEDSNAPTWSNNLSGQINLRDAVRGTISYLSPEGKQYALVETRATLRTTLIVRPRGWHLVEKHFLIAGQPVSASLFDFGLFFFHNAKELLRRGSGPYFYLPKVQSHLEARLWNDAFLFSQEYIGVPRGSIRATVLIETLPAAFEMDEILYELREHSAGLNCGRWDYIFSCIKTLRNSKDFVLPDRSLVTMDRHFLKSYVDLLIQTCHRRSIHAMGGMAAQIPIKGDPAANEAALEKVRNDKLREVKAGHDGTWVAHPGLVPVAKEVFDAHMKTSNQIFVQLEDVHVTAADLVLAPEGEITANGLTMNIDIGLKYLESWLRGNGCVPIYNLMEDAATAEISRTQVWQWLHYGATLSDGRKVTAELVRETIANQLKSVHEALGDARFRESKFEEAARIFEHLIVSPTLEDFMTLAAYKYL